MVCECINIMSLNRVEFLMYSNNICIKLLKTWEFYDWVLVFEVWKMKEGKLLYANAFIHKII